MHTQRQAYDTIARFGLGLALMVFVWGFIIGLVWFMSYVVNALVAKGIGV